MKRPSLLAALLVSTAIVGGPEAIAAEKIESSPTGIGIVLDGDPSDWEGVPIIYLKDSLHVSAIAHDEDNLYLMYRFADEGLARRLLMRGVTLWINGDGKTKNKKEEFAVRYPGSEQIAEQFEGEDPGQNRYRAETDESGKSGRGGPPPSLASMRQVPGQLTVIRMGMKETVDENDTAGPTAASAFNEGVFCYELKIPFADIGGKIADASPAKKRQLAIGVQIGGMTHNPQIRKGEADVLIGFEPAEAVRRGVTYLKEGGLALINSRITSPVEVVSGMIPYPDFDKMIGLLRKVTDDIRLFDATGIAEEAGDAITTNIVMLGSIVESGLLPYSEEVIVEVMKTGLKPQFLELNMKAFELGKKAYHSL